MIKQLSVLLLVLLLGGIANMSTAEQAKQDAQSDQAGKLLRHVVLFKFKEGTTKEEIQKVVDAFSALPKKIDAIHDFEWGTDVSVENRAQGFTHCFLVTFKDEKARDVYLPHAAHKEFGTIVRPHLADVLVVDYWTKK